MYVKLGEYNNLTDTDCDKANVCNDDGVQVIGVEAIIPHPQFRPDPDWKNDIAILQLKETPKETSQFLKIVITAVI